MFATDPKQRPHLLEKYLIEELAIALQLNPSKISSKQLLATLVDSLMALEIRNRIETDLRVQLSIENFLGENSIAQLALAVLEQLNLANLALSDDMSEYLEEIVL